MENMQNSIWQEPSKGSLPQQNSGVNSSIPPVPPQSANTGIPPMPPQSANSGIPPAPPLCAVPGGRPPYPPMAGPVPMPGPIKKPDTSETKKIKENFQIFGLASFLYACLYAFCMYRNNSGVTYPFSWQEVSSIFASALQNWGFP